MQGPLPDHNYNRLHQGAARIVIGELPVSYAESDAPPSESINSSITQFSIPGLDLNYQTDFNYKGHVHIPMTEDNEYKNKLLVVTMIADDRQENYWTLHRYMETIQSGETDGYPIEDTDHRIYGHDKQYRNRLTYIPTINIVMADDSMQKHQTLSFQRCYPLVISDLQMNFIEPAPVTFTISFVYSIKTILREEPPHEGPEKPLSVLD
jgi:hypothetical protein